MKTLFLKSTGVLVLMAAMGSAMAFPPPPPAPTVEHDVTNYTQTSYVATGSWPRDGNSESKTLPATNAVSFKSNGTWAEYYSFTVKVQDNQGNSCSAESDSSQQLNVDSNPGASATWRCVADGANLKVMPLGQ